MTDRIKVHDAKKAIYDKWYESRNTWQAENRHRFIDEWRIREYIAARNKCVANINGIKLPDLNKIPVERHALVLANHHAKLKPLHNKVAEYDEKISKCVSVDAANKHNEALLAERDALIGPEPESPGYLYRRVYEEVKPANT
jgi:hypothetical protein